MPLAILFARTYIWVSGRSESGEARTEGDCRDMSVHAWGGSLFGTVFWPYCLGGCARTCRSERLGGFARALRSPREVRASSRTGYSSIHKVISHFVYPIYRNTLTVFLHEGRYLILHPQGAWSSRSIRTDCCRRSRTWLLRYNVTQPGRLVHVSEQRCVFAGRSVDRLAATPRRPELRVLGHKSAPALQTIV